MTLGLSDLDTIQDNALRQFDERISRAHPADPAAIERELVRLESQAPGPKHLAQSANARSAGRNALSTQHQALSPTPKARRAGRVARSAGRSAQSPKPLPRRGDNAAVAV